TVSTATTKQWPRWNTPRRFNKVPSWLVHENALQQPRRNVLTSVSPWQSTDMAGRQKDTPTGLHQILSNLTTRLTVADDKYRSRRESVCATVVGGIDLKEARRYRSSAWRSGWTV